MSLRSTTLPLYYWHWGSSSEWQRSIKVVKRTFLSLLLTSSITSFLFLTFVSYHVRIFSSFSPLLSLRLEFIHAGGFAMNLWTRLWWAIEFVPFSVIWSWWGLCPAPSSLVLVLSSASTTEVYPVLRFPILRWVSRLLFNGISQGNSADIGTSNFLRATFIVSLNSSSFAAMKYFPVNSLTLSSFDSMRQTCVSNYLLDKIQIQV